MSGLNCRPVSRVKGRPALVRRLRALLLAVARCAKHRARTHDELVWSARVLDALTVTLDTADPTTDRSHVA
jgi:hypothetical protein